jgi:phosphoglycerate dehydrogenase-like enzyme
MKKFSRLVFYDLKTKPIEDWFIKKLKRFSKEVKIVYAEKEYSRALKPKDLEGADAFVTRLFDFFDDKLFLNGTLKYIGTMHTDYSHFNLRLLNKLGITLTNVPGYATEAVAELTISALLNISRKTFDAMKFVKEGGWGFEKFMGWELRDKTLGIIGLGKIGSRVAEIAKSFGMNVIYYSLHRKPEFERVGIKYSKLDELLRKSDVVSLHCSLTEKTKNILSERRLNLLKRDAVLLNSARQELVDLNALFELCKKKRVFVWFDELQDENWRKKFRKLDNIYLTPDYGWMTREAQRRLKEITLDNIKSFLKGKPKNVITSPSS